MKNGNTNNTRNNNDCISGNDGTHEFIKVIVGYGKYKLIAPNGKSFWLHGNNLGEVIEQDTQYLSKYIKIQ